MDRESLQIYLKMNSAIDHFSNFKDGELEESLCALADAFLDKKKVSEEGNIHKLLDQFELRKIPYAGDNAKEFLEELKEKIICESTNTGSPYFIGHMTSLLPDFIRPLSYLISSLNQNQVKVETARSTTFYEKQALAMLHREFYQFTDSFYENSISDPSVNLGVITSGGTIANLTALQCARDFSLGNNIEEEGLAYALQKAGYKKSVVICSHLGHYSLKKSIGLLGLGKNNLLTVKSDSDQKIDLHQLRQTMEYCVNENYHITALVGVAGTTECGSFDPLEEMAELCKEFSVHFHVDAAWGGPLIFSDKYKPLLRGIDKADSITIDGHKQLYLPVGMGMVLFKNDKLSDLISSEAEYIIRKNSYDLGRNSIEGSRPAMVFYLQAAFHILGKSGYEEILDKNIQTARLMADFIDESDEFELLTRPQSNIFLYRYLPADLRNEDLDAVVNVERINAFNVALQEKQKALGKTFVSRTQILINGQSLVALRVVIANPITTIEHCKTVLSEQQTIAEKEMVTCSI